MKKVKLTLKFFMALIIISCGSDDDNAPNDDNNGFIFQNTFYPTQYAIVSDENVIDDTPSDISIILVNVNPFETEEASNINYVFFDFEAVSINVGTINSFPDYFIFKNARYSANNEIIVDDVDNDTILNDQEEQFSISSGSVTINSISETQIDFDFTFTRVDGEVIKGSFSGGYINNSN